MLINTALISGKLNNNKGKTMTEKNKTYKLETRTVEIITLNAKNEEQAKEMAISGYSDNVRSMEFYIDEIEDITPTEKLINNN
jgi:Asp/Glu/hydantoin racemase